MNLPLKIQIEQEIGQSGDHISFARFMELALYAPNLGYYTSAIPKFSKKGDFITAPELSPLFAQSIARQCQQIFKDLNNGDILELGAGSGRLAGDLLLALEELDCLPQHYFIYEKSDSLKKQQQSFLQDHCSHLFN